MTALYNARFFMSHISKYHLHSPKSYFEIALGRESGQKLLRILKCEPGY